MSTQREAVAAFRTALESAGAKEFRLQLATDKGAALAAELSSAELRHPELATEAVAGFTAAVAEDEPAEFEARMKWRQDLSDAADRFWEAFEGQIVDGVEIIRRRA